MTQISISHGFRVQSECVIWWSVESNVSSTSFYEHNKANSQKKGREELQKLSTQYKKIHLETVIDTIIGDYLDAKELARQHMYSNLGGGGGNSNYP